MTDDQNSGRDPLRAKPLRAGEYIELLFTNESYVLQVSDGTREDTFRFWFEEDEKYQESRLYWQALTWTRKKPARQSHLQAALDGDSTTQLLVEREDVREDAAELAPDDSGGVGD